MRKNILDILRCVREKFIQLEEKRKRKRYNGGNVSIITRNCVAGVIYHDIGLEFQSPTINLWIENEEFVTFLENLENFVRRGKLIEKKTNYDYPVGVLSCDTPQGERHITLYFQHYQSFDDARRQWFKRCQRVDFDKVYVIVEDGNNLTQNIINQYETIPIEHMAILCGNTEIKGEHIVYMKGVKRKKFRELLLNTGGFLESVG